MDPWKEPTVAEAEEPEPEPKPKPEPDTEPQAASKPEPRPEPDPLPVREADWPAPTEEQLEETREPRRYDLPNGAPLGLTIGSIGLYDVPVLRSDAPGALDKGVVHARGTSMPWSRTPERNVYLAGHRLGWPGTGSHLVFYRLDELREGDEVELRDREGRRYGYKVVDTFVVEPKESWVMGRVRGRDLLTLQTCVGPNFSKRLIVRAERL